MILVLSLLVTEGCCCIPEPSWLSKKLLPEGAVVFSGLDGFEAAVGRCNNAGATQYDVSVDVQIAMTGYYGQKDTDRVAGDLLNDSRVYVPADSMHVAVVGSTYEIGTNGFGGVSGLQYRVIGGKVQCGFDVNVTNSKEKEE